MSLVADVVRLIRRPEPKLLSKEPTVESSSSRRRPPIEVLDEKPATAEELEAALARVDAERAAAQQAVLAAARRRDELLLEADSDAAIHALDAKTDTASLLLERFDRLRPELAAKLQAIEAEALQAQWAEIADRYAETALVYADKLRAAEQTAAQLNEIRREASASFRAEADAFLPYPIDLAKLVSGAVESLVPGIRHSARHPPAHGLVGDTSCTVRFLAFTSLGPQAIGYLSGQEAGFDARTAHALVDAGKAEWVSPPPPRPGPPQPAPEDWAVRFGKGSLDSITRAQGRREPE